MTVVNLSQWRVNPGMGAKFMENVLAAKAIQTRLGAQNVRLYQAAVAGLNSATFSYVSEHADNAAYGAFADKLAADPEWQQFTVEVLGSATPSATLLSISLANEVPI